MNQGIDLSARNGRGGARVRVWDLPTRVFHWLLVASVVVAVISGHVGGNAMVWHVRAGLLACALVVFRLIWGVIGPRWVRFVRFVRGPRAIVRYLRGQALPDDHFHVGHNPLGALSVLGLLGIVALQVVSGLMADDELGTAGPLVRFVSGAASGKATWWHTGPGHLAIYLLVALHVAAIVFYRVTKRDDLVTPMVHGDKLLDIAAPAAADGLGVRLLGLVLIFGLAALALWLGDSTL